MEKRFLLKNDKYEIPAIYCYPDQKHDIPAMILCHGTGSQKDEVGNLFAVLADKLMEQGIASIRFDFAGCGDSRAAQQELSFYGEVGDARKVYEYLLGCEEIDSENIGILGFSQGARVMAELLKSVPEMKCAVSWSGACHNGVGVFEKWFREYEQEAAENGYAKIPMDWRSDLLVSKEWFDEIRDSRPMDGLEQYKGAVLAIGGTKDESVPYQHAGEIVDTSENEKSMMIVVPGADHIFNVLSEDDSRAGVVIKDTVDWVSGIFR